MFNFDNLLLQVQKNLERWSVIPLSLAGKSNSVKMNTLPKFSFQCIHILVSEIIWNKNTARICKVLLQWPKSLGGMALPNFQYYYWAAYFRVFQDWLNQLQPQCSSMWLAIEVTSCLPTTITALLYSSINRSYSLFIKNVIVKTSLLIWRQFRCHYESFSTAAHIASSFVFPPSVLDKTFSQ